ncbi:MAG: hypothetical protein QM774_13500 [Gordonia sp. (in: high G+C Gram-positive bacteria)]|uniref:hypothetical protein n=1 Tax=Gordonia sp. (in: high G+C Gram-positive bacteria) TaxID=84139 RepID=UPI0039E56E36
MRFAKFKRTFPLAVAAVLAASTPTLIAPPGEASAVPVSTQRTEEVYTSTSPINGVVASVVRHHVPLPKSVGPHPAACDWVSYLRFRSADGSSDPRAADRIMIAQPGILEGAGAFESVARNTVVKAAAEGRHVEFWALDRRSNCLEDHTGLRAGVADKSFATAAGYYLHGKPVNGKRFAGFPDLVSSAGQLAWLKHVDLEQTLNDEYAIMRAEVPDQKARKQKFLCGGHSLGGFITGYFAEWDFDGNRRTRNDAGYNQCAGYFALDTAVTSDMMSMAGGMLPGDLSKQLKLTMPNLPPELGQVMDAFMGIPDTALPALALPTLINAETMNLLALVGLAANVDPQGVDKVVKELPRNLNLDSTLRILLSKDYAMAATGQPDIRKLRATNQAVLGAILDDNVQPFGFLQVSVGFTQPQDPVQPRSFPLPDAVANALPGGVMMVGDAKKFAPSSFDGRTIYRWADYDQIGPALRGKTSPSNEKTSITELARDLAEPPLDFTEWYFPTALTTSLSNRSGPAQTRHRFYPDAALRAPMITFKAGGGIQANPPNGHGRLVELPGYNHIDVLTAAWKQNDGRPEQVSSKLADFAVSPR